jgi:gas vesicle protein
MKKTEKKTSGSGKILEGAIIGAVLGVAAGILLAPDSGKKTIKNIKKQAGSFYASIAPQLKKLKGMTEEQLDAFLDMAVEKYAKAKKLTKVQHKALVQEVKKSFEKIKKNLS